LTRIAAANNSQAYYSNFLFRRLVDDPADFCAYAASILSGTTGVLSLTPKEVQNRKISLDPFNVMAA
jgi:hypothetical protein